MDVELFVWRHPKPRGAEGLCIGRTDVPVDPRKAKRLAHRIRQHARRHGLPRVVLTSPLQRTAAVGRWLARWGWQHIEDPRLAEMDFGRWDGVAWERIGAAALDAWTADFSHHAPGGAESLAELFARCKQFLDDAGVGQPACVVGHAGWMSAARHVVDGKAPPTRAADWPRPARHAQLLRISTRQEQLS